MSSIATADPPGSLEAGVWHVWVDYDGPVDRLELRMSSAGARPAATVLTKTLDLEAVIAPEVYVGFTAATGGSFARHEILSFYFHNDAIPGGIDLDREDYVQAPAQVTLSASPNTIPADGTTSSTIEATARDVGGRPMPGQTITFTTDLGTVDPLSAVTDGRGVATTSLSASTTGTATVRGTATGGAYGQVQVALSAPTPPLVTLAASPPAIPADGSTTSTISATVQSAGGTLLFGQTVSFTTDLGTLDPPSAVTDKNGVATARLSATTAGTATVRGTTASGAYGEVQVAVTPSAPAPPLVTLAAAPSAIPADGKMTSTISATVQTASGTLLFGQTVSFTTDLGTVDPPLAVTDKNGVATTRLSGSTAGTATVRGTIASGAHGEVQVKLASDFNIYLPLVVR
jgi:hypothetical protein